MEELCEKEVDAKKKPSTGNKKQSLQREKATAEKNTVQSNENRGQTQKWVEKSIIISFVSIGYLQKKAIRRDGLRREKH